MQITRRNIRNMEQLEALRKDWERLESGSEMTVFQTFRWHALLAEEVRRTPLSFLLNRIVVYELSDGGEVKLLLPLVVQRVRTRFRWFGRNRGVYILGHNSWSDYNNAIYCEVSDDELRQVLDRVRKDFRGYQILFTDLYPGTALDRVLSEQRSACGHKEAVCVHPRADAAAYNASLSKHTRQNLRTAVNRMQRDGYQYSVRKFGMLQDTALAGQLVDLHFGRFLKKNTGKKGLSHRLASFVKYHGKHFLEYRNNIVRESMLHMPDSCLILVYMNEQLAGYLYGLYDGDAIRIMQNCFSEEYAFYSPMFRCAHELILETYENRLEYHGQLIRDIDFTRGDDEYKYKLGGTEILLNSYLL